MNDDEEIKIEMAIVLLSILELPINIYTTPGYSILVHCSAQPLKLLYCCCKICDHNTVLVLM